MLFCVVGYLHPPDRYTAYLKYVPGEEGKWSRGNTCFTRIIPFYHVSQVENTYKYLHESFPQYLFDCPVRNIQISSVPKDNVKKYYKPRIRMKEILCDPKDSLERNLSDLITILSGYSGLDDHTFGVTGSILTATHNPLFSDIDITVYGLNASNRLKRTILEMRGVENVVQPFNPAKKEVWSMNRLNRFPLSFKDLMEFVERRWNYGLFRDTYFSIHPVRVDQEITEEYGDQIFTPVGEITGSAIIKNADESFFLPAIYQITELCSDIDVTVSRLVSYESIYCDMFDTGERVEFRGKLEKVLGSHNNFYQVVIGGAGSKPSYIRRFISSLP